MITLQRTVPPVGSHKGAVSAVGPATSRARCLSAGTETCGTSFSSVSFFFAESLTGFICITMNTGRAGKRFTLAHRLVEYESTTSKPRAGQAVLTTLWQLDASG